MSNYPIIQHPLKNSEVDNLLDDENYISAIVPLDLDTIIDADGMEGFNNIVEERLLRQGIMADITYRPVGILDGMILIQVTCQVDM